MSEQGKRKRKRRHDHQESGRTRRRQDQSRRKREPKDQDIVDPHFGWMFVGDRRMFVVGYTPGGVPFGCYEDEFEDFDELEERSG